jgi:hypothetical protein
VTHLKTERINTGILSQKLSALLLGVRLQTRRGSNVLTVEPQINCGTGSGDVIDLTYNYNPSLGKDPDRVT